MKIMNLKTQNPFPDIHIVFMSFVCFLKPPHFRYILWIHPQSHAPHMCKHQTLIRCCNNVGSLSVTMAQLLIIIGLMCPVFLKKLHAQQTRGIHTMLFQCWPTVFDAGTALNQHWVNGPCLLGQYTRLYAKTHS